MEKSILIQTKLKNNFLDKQTTDCSLMNKLKLLFKIVWVA